jgi:Pvc16 N-terminal domain/Carboxypeptidase regulatory-like domain
MLSIVHEVLRGVVYRGAGFGPEEVDVRFEPPTREFIDRLDRPTVTMVPLDFIENLELGRKDFQVRRGERYHESAFPARRIDARYMTTALASDPADEQELIWRMLAVMLRTPEIPFEFLPESISRFNTPVVVKAARPDEDLKLLDVWSNLGVESHPSFTCVVTLPIDPDLVTRSPLVLTRVARFGRRDVDQPTDERMHVGGVIRDAEGRPVAQAIVDLDGATGGGAVTDANGRFVLRSLSSGPQTVRVRRADGSPLEVSIEPPNGPYDVTVE